MVGRTLDGNDIDGVQFEKYSKAYAKKKGVPDDSVDLFLNGDMLPSISKVDNKQRNIAKIAVKGKTNNLASYNHNTGDTLPKRTHFGLTESEADEIAQKVLTAREVKGPPKKTRSIADLIDSIELEQIE